MTDPGVLGFNDVIKGRQSYVIAYDENGKKKSLKTHNRTDSQQSTTSTILNDYAQIGEWGRLTEKEKVAVLDEMKRLRDISNGYLQEAGKGQLHLKVLGLILLGIFLGKRSGIIPSWLFPSPRLVFIPAFLTYLYRTYKNRAGLLENPHTPGAPEFYPIVGTIEPLFYAASGIAKLVLAYDKKTNFQTWELSFSTDKRVVLVSDPIDRRYMLKDNWKNFLKNVDVVGSPNFTYIFGEIVGRGIFGTDKREWQDHRKIASAMFAGTVLKTQMQDVFNKHTRTLVELLDKKALSGESFDIQNLFQGFTFDTICEIAFGHNPEALTIAERGEKMEFLHAFDYCQTGCTSRFARGPFFQMQKYFGIGVEGELPIQMKKMKKYILDIISERRKQADFATRNDLLSLYLQHAKKTGETYMEEDEYLQDVILNFMIAGRDTTACTLTNWIKLTYSSHRKSEITSAFEKEIGKCGVSDLTKEDLTWDHISNCTYADAMFNETLRMYPPVALDFRLAEEDDILPGSGFKVKQTTICAISNISIGRNPSLWSNPDVFTPERWILKEGEKIRRVDEYVHPVFWGGPRLCLGKDMARFEAKLVAAQLLKYDFEIAKHDDFGLVNGPVCFYQDGLSVKCSIKKIVQ